MHKRLSIQTVVLLLTMTAILIGGVVVVWSIRQVTQPLAGVERTVATQLERLVNPTPTVRPDPVTIVKEMRSLRRLETAAYTMEKIITAESRQGPLAFLLGDRLILVAHGQVIAGVDLDQFDEHSVTVHDDGSVSVILPRPEVFVTALSSEESYVFDRNTGVMGLKVDLEAEARRVAEEEIRRAALEDGILDMAQKSAEATVRRLILTLGFEDVHISY